MEIVLMNDNAVIPTRASKESAGLDLYSSIDVDIEVERNNKEFGEMDKIDSIRRFSDEIF